MERKAADSIPLYSSGLLPTVRPRCAANRPGTPSRIWISDMAEHLANSYRLDGMFGQFCLVLPDQDAVIAIPSHEEKNPNDILRLVWQTLAPHL